MTNSTIEKHKILLDQIDRCRKEMVQLQFQFIMFRADEECRAYLGNEYTKSIETEIDRMVINLNGIKECIRR